MRFSRRAVLALPPVLAALPARAQEAGTAARPLRIGVTAGPHAQVLENVRVRAAEAGLHIRIVEFQDYIQPNQALAAGDLDANSYQHQPFLDDQVKARGYDLVTVGKTLLFPIGVYSRKVKSVAEIRAGGQIGIPNDPTNGGRALVLLAKAGAIGLKPGADHRATVLDITDNPRRIRLVELEAALLPRSLDDTDASVINTNYAINAGLNPLRDSIAIEDSNSPYANVIAARRADAGAPWVKTLLAVYQSDATRRFVADTFGGAVIVAF